MTAGILKKLLEEGYVEITNRRLIVTEKFMNEIETERRKKK